MITEEHADLVMSVLMDRLLELKADDDGSEYDESIHLLIEAIDYLDEIWIERGFDL
jgi:hypothetical protein